MEKYEDRTLLAMLSIGPSGLHGAEGAAVTLQATLSQPSMQPTDFTFRTVAGTALSGTDYQEVLNGSGTIPPGATFANISIQLFDDYYTELGETFSVELLTATGATIDPAASSVSVTIDDVESGGGSGGGGTTSLTLSVPTNVNEGDGFVLTAQMSPPGTYEISAMVDWGVTPGAGPAGFSGTTNPDGSFTIGHQYFDDGPAPGNGTPQDAQSITLTGTATQFTPEGPVYYPLSGVTSTTIHNVAPSPVFDVYNYMPIGGPRWVASGTYQDVGLTDRATLEIDWGDGSPSIIGSDLEVGETFWQVHRYPPDGLAYTITMTITDDDTGVIAYSKDFELYLLDLDNDANNNGEIAANDEPLEPVPTGYPVPEPPTAGPGRRISVNADDDNWNDIPDMLENGPISGENDLEPFLVKWRGDMRPDISNYAGWHLTLEVLSWDPGEFSLNPRIWFSPNKGDELDLVDLSPTSDGHGKEWIIGNELDPIPEILYVEARQTGGIGLELNLWTPSGEHVEADTIAFFVLPPPEKELLTIYDGQFGQAISDASEDFTGAVTVANKNDTDADNIPDNADTSVKEIHTGADEHGRNEVDLMRLDVLRPQPSASTVYVDVNLPDRVEFWNESTKESLAPRTVGGRVAIEFTNHDGGLKFRTIWVELKDVSSAHGDVEITGVYNLWEDKVIATGIWATNTATEYRTLDYAALSAPWTTEMDDHIQATVENVHGGTGTRPNSVFTKIEEGPPPVHIKSFTQVILFQFEFKPLNIQETLPRVKFDPTRQVKYTQWHTNAAGTVVNEFRMPYPQLWEQPNDDPFRPLENGGENDESHEPFQESHVYSQDGPGIDFDRDAGETYVKQAIRANFWEWMRVRLDGTRPRSNAPAPPEGSICSPYTGWHAIHAIKKVDDGAGHMIWQRDGLNEIGPNHLQSLDPQ